MKKFEYLVAANLLIDAINQLGNEGWELITVIEDPAFKNQTFFLYYFKREKQ